MYMFFRRKFIEKVLGGVIGLIVVFFLFWVESEKNVEVLVVIFIWNNVNVNWVVWVALIVGKLVLDVVEIGVMIVEVDFEDMFVGYGGWLDCDGCVIFDVSIMNVVGDCGLVCFLQDIKYFILVVCKVMEEMLYVMFVGVGVCQFVLENGFQEENLFILEVE